MLTMMPTMMSDSQSVQGDAPERRSVDRLPLRVAATVRIAGHVDTPARTRDVSRDGCSIVGDLSFEPGNEGTLVIALRETTFSIPCVVRYRRPLLSGTQLGVQFRFVDDEQTMSFAQELREASDASGYAAPSK